MRLILFLTVIFFQLTSSVIASSKSTEGMEGINLNLKDHEIAVTFLGLSDGEATLIQGPDDENILVNTGGEGAVDEIQALLKLYGVKQIQALIITNNYNLNENSISQIISNYSIDKLIATSQILSDIKNKVGPEIELVSWSEGMKEELFPDLTMEVLFSGEGENEGLDFTLQFFKHRLFLMNSFSQHAEEILLKKNLEDISVFKIPNWAYEDSLSEKLIQYINPQISILFESEKHQPDADIINDIQDTWSEILFTKKHGTITVKFTESTYEVFTFN